MQLIEYMELHLRMFLKEELEYQQYKDKIKMQYAIDMGYEYLSIPYSTEYDDSYKAIIDDKISEILSLTTQN